MNQGFCFPGFWQAICSLGLMILVIIRMEVLSEKRMELSQTIASLSGSIKDGEGMPAQQSNRNPKGGIP